MQDAHSADQGDYRLDRLGWLQFERLASLALEAETGLRDLDWQDRAYRGRIAWVEESVVLAGAGVTLPGPVVVGVVWVRDHPSQPSRRAEFVTHMVGSADEPNPRFTGRILQRALHGRRREALRGQLVHEPLEVAARERRELADAQLGQHPEVERLAVRADRAGLVAVPGAVRDDPGAGVLHPRPRGP